MNSPTRLPIRSCLAQNLFVELKEAQVYQLSNCINLKINKENTVFFAKISSKSSSRITLIDHYPFFLPILNIYVNIQDR